MADNTFAVDFPGSDSLDDDHRQYFSEFGQLANLFVFVFPYSGTANETLVENVKAAYEKQRQAGKFAKTIFCLNKCGNDDYAGDTFDENYKEEFLEKIRRDIAKRDFKKEEGAIKKAVSQFANKAKLVGEQMYGEIIAVGNELKEYVLKNLDAKDFIFTDWENESPARGIYGSREVKNRIEDYLRLTDTLPI